MSDVAGDMKVTGKSVQRWFEIALFEHWSAHPHGIARVTQKLFQASLVDLPYQYFYFHPLLEEFVVPADKTFFVSLAEGQACYDVAHLPPGAALGSDFQAQVNDVVFTGCSWEYPAYVSNVRSLRKQARLGTLAVLVYDLIAIHHPHFFMKEFGERVGANLVDMLSACDHAVCISESTRSDVKAIAAPDKTSAVFRLGEDLPMRAPRAVASRPYVLCVGTVEVRKNHVLLYWVWQKLVQRHGKDCPRLVIVGRIGWLASDVAELMVRDPLTRDYIEIRSNVDDGELAQLYESSMFTVYPSHYEGYGLPVSESLNIGRLCVTSDASSLPEINPFPELMFDPSDPDAALQIMERLISNPELVAGYERLIAQVYVRQSWAASVRDFDVATFGVIQ